MMESHSMASNVCKSESEKGKLCRECSVEDGDHQVYRASSKLTKKLPVLTDLKEGAIQRDLVRPGPIYDDLKLVEKPAHVQTAFDVTLSLPLPSVLHSMTREQLDKIPNPTPVDNSAEHNDLLIEQTIEEDAKDAIRQQGKMVPPKIEIPTGEQVEMVPSKKIEIPSDLDDWMVIPLSATDAEMGHSAYVIPILPYRCNNAEGVRVIGYSPIMITKRTTDCTLINDSCFVCSPIKVRMPSYH